MRACAHPKIFRWFVSRELHMTATFCRCASGAGQNTPCCFRGGMRYPCKNRIGLTALHAADSTTTNQRTQPPPISRLKTSPKPWSNAEHQDTIWPPASLKFQTHSWHISHEQCVAYVCAFIFHIMQQITPLIRTSSGTSTGVTTTCGRSTCRATCWSPCLVGTGSARPMTSRTG